LLAARCGASEPPAQRLIVLSVDAPINCARPGDCRPLAQDCERSRALVIHDAAQRRASPCLRLVLGALSRRHITLWSKLLNTALARRRAQEAFCCWYLDRHVSRQWWRTRLDPVRWYSQTLVSRHPLRSMVRICCARHRSGVRPVEEVPGPRPR